MDSSVSSKDEIWFLRVCHQTQSTWTVYHTVVMPHVVILCFLSFMSPRILIFSSLQRGRHLYSFDLKESWGWHPVAGTCRRLICHKLYFISYMGWCIDFTHSVVSTLSAVWKGILYTKSGNRFVTYFSVKISFVK
jgi:hypothetical protein